MPTIFQGLVKAIGWASVAIWGLLTFVVFVFLIDRWEHPYTKSISNKDLLDYGEFSIWLLSIFILSRIIIRLFSAIKKTG